jgi:hypothetical protein
MEQLSKKIGSFTDIMSYNSPLNLMSLSYSFTKSVSCLVNGFAVVTGSVVSGIAMGGVDAVVNGIVTGGVDAVGVGICGSVRP